jgi:F-type H+-transporting ATPase subunit alpha
MKKVAGTLRLDLAQFRELEAFAKFGSDLDAATQRQLRRGERLVELLKQGQYQPVPVEEQIAMIFVSTQGLIDDIPVERVKEFEKDFLERLTLNHADLMKELRKSGKLTDEVTDVFRKIASDLVSVYVNQ